MKVTIDNFDGQGGVDYTGQLCGKSPAVIERKLNQPSRCKLTLGPKPLNPPVAQAQVAVSADNGVLLFTGYVVAAPARVFQGLASEGPLYVLEVVCESDEFLLQAPVTRNTTESIASSAGALLSRMMTRAGVNALPVSGDALGVQVGGFQARPGRSWASNVGALADAAHARYRALNGQLLFESVGARVHTLSETDGSLDRNALRGARIRAAVEDVTVCGPVEPQAFVTEIFQGDGITASFRLGEVPLLSRETVLSDGFTASTVDPQVWSVVEGGSAVSSTARGLTLSSAGTGIVTAIDPVELGGALLFELEGLQLDSAGEAHVAGLADGAVSAANLVAGFHLQSSGSSVTAVPVVLGVQAGASVALQVGNSYTFRLRFYCKERQRALQTYTSSGANGSAIEGGGSISAGAMLLMEVQETTGGAQFAPTVLYDGSIMSAPLSATPVVISSASFVGSVARVQLTRPGDVWVTCAAQGGSPVTQRLGASAQTAQARVTSAGELTFFPGQTPAVGSTVAVFYRTGGHAVARMTSGASAGQTSGAGSVVVRLNEPRARTSADCESAALAILATSTWSEGAWKGTYETWNAQQGTDMWPGDLLEIAANSAGLMAPLLIRAVTIQTMSTVPEMLRYAIEYANEWAEEFSVRSTVGAAANVWLPMAALTTPSALPSTAGLTIAGVSTTKIEVAAGLTPPVGGGFEVRRGDGGFGPSSGGDLVLRSPAADFTIVREAAVERYFVRMYDGATPPNYSRHSSALFVNAAMQ